jgi:hypothetical protein
MLPFSLNRGYSFPPIREALDGVMGMGSATCIKTACDPLMTIAERTVREDGSLGVCEHVYAADGVTHLQAEDGQYQHHRYMILPSVPHENGGCLGGPGGIDGPRTCRYWAVCTGDCPGASIDGDWRNKTRFCESWFELYEACERWLRLTFPNITLLSDVAGAFEANELYASIHSSEPLWEPMVYMQKKYTPQPSAWKGEARQGKGPLTLMRDYEKAQEKKMDEEGHVDVPHCNEIVHEDSDAEVTYTVEQLEDE